MEKQEGYVIRFNADNLFKGYIDSLTKLGSKKRAVYTANAIVKHGVDFNKICDYSASQYKDLLIDLKPSDYRQFRTYVNDIRRYLSYVDGINNSNCMENFEPIQQNCVELWDQMKVNTVIKRKYLSLKEFSALLSDIDMKEEYNPLYYTTLLTAFYEGLYDGEDLNIVCNIRRSDITDNVVDCGRRIVISKALARDMTELSFVSKWEKYSPRGVVGSNELSGYFDDDVFKISSNVRAGATKKHSLYRRVRYITSKYCGRSVSPYQLYISGILYRVSVELSRYDIDIKEAILSKKNHDTLIARKVIEDELTRCGSSMNYYSFRASVNEDIKYF